MKILFGTLTVALFSIAAAADSAVPGKGATCVFTNRDYAGPCTENVEYSDDPSNADAECDKILTCLNDVRCIQTYCRNTTIRFGWKLDDILFE